MLLTRVSEERSNFALKKLERKKKLKKIIEVKDLRVGFSTTEGYAEAVRGISFFLEKAEVLAIVGESGSGKSVSSKAIMRILPERTRCVGEVLFEGKNLLSISEGEMCKIRGGKIAMIFQDPLSSLNPTVRVGLQIREALLIRSPKMSKAEARMRSIELMREVGIQDAERRYEEYPFQFSGGMRQRIVIAIALAADPEVLICDEPTTALDVTIEAQILDLIESLKKKRGLSVLFITHDLGVVARIADRIAVMYAGKIVEHGTSEEIFFDPRHPYTWALFSSIPSLTDKKKLETISGFVPSISEKTVGDAFAPRNKYALRIDYEMEPPTFQISETHGVASWLLHPLAPHVEMPESLKKKIEKERALPNDS